MLLHALTRLTEKGRCESAEERDDVEHTLVDDPDFEPGVTIPVRLRQSSRERRPVRHDDYVRYLTNEIGTDPISFNDATSCDGKGDGVIGGKPYPGFSRITGKSQSN
ncbi:hypothetical protein QE152_g27841 [Popillia japonica]|uniref:Uncharacterized protein n=1 Tax=Popillia japonica TaxID=7064 RepID=A0AAW1JK39_POPJA